MAASSTGDSAPALFTLLTQRACGRPVRDGVAVQRVALCNQLSQSPAAPAARNQLGYRAHSGAHLRRRLCPMGHHAGAAPLTAAALRAAGIDTRAPTPARVWLHRM